ncbi:unnamed protein product (macronuclear) [Paramecium tetraurelia]|uniref:Uncharacterized protein n=1 Tax=Paramecium tetraurelia TaxID=5888 RepID=A0BU56_PARTE|nr:uncharacterized protein GSPATT00032305001 [Paramecium tetraurelia]CAK62073.1 unnamed protein product [Paramecium tetraurelia]|eukprot:XP_001429471.1 hypothetical protein (macronuclear) [Paramecium tetraurelia strain d4-2]
MNKQLDFNLNFPKHDQSKFQCYNEVKNGFYLNNPNDVYYFDENEGWADYNGCYYDKNGCPAGWVFVSQGKYTRYNMNYEEINNENNKYYHETISEEEMQKRQFQDQNSQQKSSCQMDENSQSNQNVDEQSQSMKQPFGSLKEHQQNFQRYVQDNNMQLHQTQFQQRNYQKGYQAEQQTQLQSHDYHRDQNYNQNQHWNKPQNKFNSYQKDQHNDYQNRQHHNNNKNFNNQDNRNSHEYQSESNQNRNYQIDNRSYNNHNNNRNQNNQNRDDPKCFELYNNQKYDYKLKNPFTEQTQQQQLIYKDKRRNDDQDVYPKVENRKEQSINYKYNYSFQKNEKGQQNRHPDYNNYQNNYNQSKNDRQKFHKNNNYKQNGNFGSMRERNQYDGDTQQQFQYVLCKNNSQEQYEFHQPHTQPIQQFEQSSNQVQDKQGAPEKRERKSRLNDPIEYQQ